MTCKALVVRLRRTCTRAGGAISTGGKSGSRSSSTRISCSRARSSARRAASAATAFRSPGRQVLGIGPGELQEPRDDPLEPIDLVDQVVEALFAQTQPASPELGDAADAGQRIPDLVGHSGEQLPQRRQALAPPQFGPEPLAFDAPGGGPSARDGLSGRARERSRPGPGLQTSGIPGPTGRCKIGSTSRVMVQVAATTRPSTRTGAVRMAIV